MFPACLPTTPAPALTRACPAPAPLPPAAGLLRLSQEHPGDASAAPLHTLLCHLLTDGGSYSEAQLQAEAGYKLVEGQYGLANPAAVSLQGIQLGVSLAGEPGALS